MTVEPIETPRLILRPIVEADWPAILSYMGDPIVTAWLPEGRFEEDAARAFARKQAGRHPEAIAARLKDTGQMIGHMVFRPWTAPQTFEIGWVLARAHQRRGYATEAARALLAHAFGPLGAHRVIATCQPENTASWRVMETLGMRREGLFRSCIYRSPGVWWDEYVYALLAEEYRQVQAGGGAGAGLLKEPLEGWLQCVQPADGPDLGIQPRFATLWMLQRASDMALFSRPAPDGAGEIFLISEAAARMAAMLPGRWTPAENPSAHAWTLRVGAGDPHRRFGLAAAAPP
jgi:RimJ/RimL family protein N-acetyltransferase